MKPIKLAPAPVRQKTKDETEFEFDFSIPEDWADDLIMVLRAGAATLRPVSS